MKKLFTTPSGVFLVDVQKQVKIAQLFMRNKHPQQDELIVLEGLLSGDSVFADVGANIGTITVPMAKIAKKVMAFEPVEANFELLKENVALNHLSGVTLYQKAAGAKYARVALEAQDNSDAGTYSIRGAGDIEMIPIDSLAARIDVMKIDVEGYEPEVVRGAGATLKRCKTALLFEVNMIETRKRGDWFFLRIGRELRSLGYSIYRADGTKRPVSSIWWHMFTQAPKAFLTGRLHYSVNLLALPKLDNVLN